jgi:hypothetical protein
VSWGQAEVSGAEGDFEGDHHDDANDSDSLDHDPLGGDDGAELTTLHDAAKAAYSTYWRKMELDETQSPVVLLQHTLRTLVAHSDFALPLVLMRQKYVTVFAHPPNQADASFQGSASLHKKEAGDDSALPVVVPRRPRWIISG